MTFYAFGLNHKTAAVAAREAFSFNEEAACDFYGQISLSDEGECMLLSTCNRTEVYLFGTERDLEQIKSYFVRWAQACNLEGLDPFLYQDEVALRHLLEVTCGLRSQVLGDGQILSQVKDAYRLAVEVGGVTSIMHRLLHTAFRTAKCVINETALTDGLTSIASAAVKTARHHFERTLGIAFKGQRVLIVGAGEMARHTGKALRSYGIRDLVITNRTEERARNLATHLWGTHLPWQHRYEAIQGADLVIVATGAREPVVHAEELPALPSTEVSILLVDIALPRNVDPAADQLPGYKVIDLDRIDQRLEEAEDRRHQSIPAAKAICEEALHEFVTWIFHQQAMQPAIHTIRNTFEMIRRQEINRHHHRFSEADRKELDHITRSILQKLLAVPVVRLKNVDPGSIDYVRGIRVLHALFSPPNCDNFPIEKGQVPEDTFYRLLEGNEIDPVSFVFEGLDTWEE